MSASHAAEDAAGVFASANPSASSRSSTAGTVCTASISTGLPVTWLTINAPSSEVAAWYVAQYTDKLSTVVLSYCRNAETITDNAETIALGAPVPLRPSCGVGLRPLVIAWGGGMH